MGGRLRRLHAAVVSLLLAATTLVALEASAAQLNASEGPRISGPLALAEKECEFDTRETESGDLAATVKSCVYFFFFDDSEEEDNSDDYGVAWFQSNVNTAKGWCALSFRSKVPVPSGSALTALQPRGVRNIDAPANFTTNLKVDAEGAAVENGRVKKNSRLYPDKLRSRVLQQGSKVRFSWTGSSPKRLGFAFGFELAWDAGTSPNLQLEVVLDTDFKKKDEC
jgi:hypothetical protein